MIPTRRLFAVAALTILAGLPAGCGSAAERTLDDIHLTSVAGQDAAGPLPWIEDHPVGWRMATMPGEDTVSIGAPCSPMSAPIRITSEELVVETRRMSIAAIACSPPVNEYDLWLLDFLSAPLGYTWDGRTLVMTNDRGSLTFQRRENP